MAAMLDKAVLRMPLHLLSMVLAHLDSVPSLASAIFAHSSFYAAFNEGRDRIVRQIITKQIPSDIMYYAMRTHAAAQWDLDRDGLRRIRDFLFESFHSDFRRIDARDESFTTPGPVDMGLASRLSKTQVMVQHFTRGFLRDTLPLARRELGLQRRDYTSGSEVEEFRIHRAIYRFQLYCNIFRRPYSRGQAQGIRAELFNNFFSNFPSWVNEQLACIHDYFDRVLSTAYDEVAAHDVQWGLESVNWMAPASASRHRQRYLFRGLDFLYQLDLATTYDRRRELLQSRGEPSPRIKHMFYGELSNGSTFVDRHEWVWWWCRLPEWIDRSDYESITKWWQYTELDAYGSGPWRMWYASHRAHWERVTWSFETHAWLRRCGYVIWDHPETPLKYAELEARMEEARKLSLLDHCRRKDPDLRCKMRRSWKERAEIHRRGGRGYWSEGNLSRIVWTGGESS